MILSDLSHHGLIAFSGEDTRAFLHAQLTSDVNALLPGRSQYSGYCTPKGRLLASFLLWRNESDYLLQLPAALREPIQRRLSSYILRSRVKTRDASTEFARFGIAGDGAEARLQALFGNIPHAPHEVTYRDGVILLGLPGERFEIVVVTDKAAAIRRSLAENAETASPGYWEWLDVRAGIPVITPATQEEFVPQMVNFDAIGAVSFNKGCYPGQEIVARTHYLGRLKQRMFLAHVATDAAPQPGNKLYSADMGDQASGVIVNAAASPAGGYDMLAVIQLSSVAAGVIHLGTPDGPALQLLDLPYSVPAPRAANG